MGNGAADNNTKSGQLLRLSELMPAGTEVMETMNIFKNLKTRDHHSNHDVLVNEKLVLNPIKMRTKDLRRHFIQIIICIIFNKLIFFGFLFLDEGRKIFETRRKREKRRHCLTLNKLIFMFKNY